MDKVKQATPYNKWLLLFWMALGVYHLLTLSYSPLPWFDETVFASISRSVMHGEGFMLKAAPFYTHSEPVLVYGPLYFGLQAVVMWLLGFSEWSFRLLNLLSGAGVLLAVNYMLKQRVQRPIRIATVILLAFETIFLQNAHSGRMDLLALLLVLLSYSPVLKWHTGILSLSVSALFALAAMLTTPRIAIFLLPLGCWLLYILVKEKKMLPVLAFSIIFLLGYYIWIWTGFGGIEEFLQYYSNSVIQKDNEDLLDAFVGGSLSIAPFQIPMVLLAVGTLFVSKRKWSWLSFICIINILVFYLIVKDTGIYSALVVPFWLMLLAENIEAMKKYSPRLRMVPYIIIGAVSIGIFAVKTLTIFAGMEERNPSHIAHWVKQHIPAGSKVVGEYKYYYAVIKNGSDFQFIELGGTPAERAAYQMDAYNPDYILISTETDKATFAAYINRMGKYKKAEIDPIKDSEAMPGIMSSLIMKLPVSFSSGYKGETYKRIK